MEQAHDKPTIRRQLREKLAAMSDADRAAKSLAATALMTASPEFIAARAVMLYLSGPYEVDTAPLALRCWQTGKMVIVPKVSWDQRRMLPVEITSLQTSMTTTGPGVREPVSGKIKLEFPARPMLGCIGVAAPGDFAPTSAPSGNYGGNLDYNEIGEGATVIFPVFHPGGLLYMGDGHAIMADGEPTGTGVETSMDVEFSVEIRKNARVTGPRVENADYLISVGSQPEFASSLDRALQLATSDMVHWLVDDYQLEPWAAHQLIGAVGKYDVVTVAGSMALKVPRKYLTAK